MPIYRICFYIYWGLQSSKIRLGIFKPVELLTQVKLKHWSLSVNLFLSRNINNNLLYFFWAGMSGFVPRKYIRAWYLTLVSHCTYYWCVFDLFPGVEAVSFNSRQVWFAVQFHYLLLYQVNRSYNSQCLCRHNSTVLKLSSGLWRPEPIFYDTRGMIAVELWRNTFRGSPRKGCCIWVQRAVEMVWNLTHLLEL